jgi:hypothetical protein
MSIRQKKKSKRFQNVSDYFEREQRMKKRFLHSMIEIDCSRQSKNQRAKVYREKKVEKHTNVSLETEIFGS